MAAAGATGPQLACHCGDCAGLGALMLLLQPLEPADAARADERGALPTDPPPWRLIRFGESAAGAASFNARILMRTFTAAQRPR